MKNNKLSWSHILKPLISLPEDITITIKTDVIKEYRYRYNYGYWGKVRDPNYELLKVVLIAYGNGYRKVAEQILGIKDSDGDWPACNDYNKQMELMKKTLLAIAEKKHLIKVTDSSTGKVLYQQ
jgi:hypothetical protein